MKTLLSFLLGVSVCCLRPSIGMAADEGESFWVAGLPVDFSAVDLEGTAPYTIKLKSPKVDGEGWKWNFGDGATGTGTVGRHTYEKPGHYIAVARKGKSVHRQGVTVLPPKGPRAKTVSALDPRHVLVVFEEPVKIDGAAVKLASGRAAAKLYLDPLGRQLVAEFDQPLAAKETLVLEKITDRAQSPNAVANPRLPVQRPSWPADTTGLVFLWENAKAENRIWDPVLGGVREAVMYAGANHFDRDGALVCGQGLSDAGVEAPQQLIAGCKASEALSVEMVVRPESLEQSGKDGILALLAMSHGWPNGTFFLSQNKSRLQVALARQSGDSQPPIFDLGALPSAGPHHIVAAMAPKRLALYVDGAKVREVDPSPAKILMMAPPLRFGGCNEKWLWKGRMEGIAMYGRFVEEAEAARGWNAYRAKLAARKPMERLVVDARLVAKTPAPEPKHMMPYRSALVVYEYAVQKVKDGKAIKNGQVLRVAHWGVRDMKKTPVAERAVGSEVQLTLERFADHPELEGQFLRDDLPFSEADLWTDGGP